MPNEFNSADFPNPFASLIRHFESNSIQFRWDPGAKSVEFVAARVCAAFIGYFQVSVDDGTLHISFKLPIVARDSKMRPFVTETLVRINNNLNVGAFDHDLDTGQIWFYAGQLIPAGVLDGEVMFRLFNICFNTCDRYFPALMRVMFAGHTPVDAIYLSELDLHAERIKQAGAKTMPTPSPPKPETKKPRASRKKSRRNFTQELPGLFDKKPGENDGGSANN